MLNEAYEHRGKDIQDIGLRGEYLYTANGPGGFEVFDVANIDQKGFSERIVSAPVSPLGQRTCVHTKYRHVSIALPSTLALDPARVRLPENEEQPIDLFYAFVYVSDREEGLVIVQRRHAGRWQSRQQFPEGKRNCSFQSGRRADRRDVCRCGGASALHDHAARIVRDRCQRSDASAHRRTADERISAQPALRRDSVPLRLRH